MDFLNGLAVFFGLIAIILLQLKIYMYFKLKNPDKNFLLAYVTGRVIPFIFMALFPVSTNNYPPEVKRKIETINWVTYFFYMSMVVMFVIVIIISLLYPQQ